MSDPVSQDGEMKQTNRVKPTRTSSRSQPAVATIVPPDFQQLVDVSTTEVEQCTVPEFLNRIHFSRCPEDIIRFGSKVRAMADAGSGSVSMSHYLHRRELAFAD